MLSAFLGRFLPKLGRPSRAAFFLHAEGGSSGRVGWPRQSRARLHRHPVHPTAAREPGRRQQANLNEARCSAQPDRARMARVADHGGALGQAECLAAADQPGQQRAADRSPDLTRAAIDHPRRASDSAAAAGRARPRPGHGPSPPRQWPPATALPPRPPPGVDAPARPPRAGPPRTAQASSAPHDDRRARGDVGLGAIAHRHARLPPGQCYGRSAVQSAAASSSISRVRSRCSLAKPGPRSMRTSSM